MKSYQMTLAMYCQERKAGFLWSDDK